MLAIRTVFGCLSRKQVQSDEAQHGTLKRSSGHHNLRRARYPLPAARHALVEESRESTRRESTNRSALTATARGASPRAGVAGSQNVDTEAICEANGIFLRNLPRQPDNFALGQDGVLRRHPAFTDGLRLTHLPSGDQLLLNFDPSVIRDAPAELVEAEFAGFRLDPTTGIQRFEVQGIVARAVLLGLESVYPLLDGQWMVPQRTRDSMRACELMLWLEGRVSISPADECPDEVPTEHIVLSSGDRQAELSRLGELLLTRGPCIFEASKPPRILDQIRQVEPGRDLWFVTMREPFHSKWMTIRVTSEFLWGAPAPRGRFAVVYFPAF
jgi:hypothetical protein